MIAPKRHKSPITTDAAEINVKIEISTCEGATCFCDWIQFRDGAALCYINEQPDFIAVFDCDEIENIENVVFL